MVRVVTVKDSEKAVQMTVEKKKHFLAIIKIALKDFSLVFYLPVNLKFLFTGELSLVRLSKIN